MHTTTTRRLTGGDEVVARDMFAVMAAAFDETVDPVSDAYVSGLLTTSSFWAVAAFDGARVIGGITAHTIPMTRSSSSELFVYDLAVHEEHRRRGVGSQLFLALRAYASEAGISDIFVPADEEDGHALAFYRSLGGQESPVRFFAWGDGTR